ncbi:hypothetical protein CH330_03285 [candidate division WOR-3 bacterium JGI_Cruoil_03_51_56]|uniref:Uncharacterized protein n=1 Tax=candidate division WOR-3 bacterium JGI_Cruoil_03_51_56 TaxID=1973747 RepID=A0A235BW00_UNCW3|nr:MAG: hypothetical protein CH330_03285 [candidate division WOR-3 bacterium JGI_Cruoil_03_51_56]
MRRTVFGLLILVAAAGLILTASCQRENALRIVTINDGETLMSDIIDFGEITIEEPGEEPEKYIITQIPQDVVGIELQYVEIGLGLPTLTPYKAHITKIQISYRDAAGTEYDPIVLPVNIVVDAEPEGKKTEKSVFSLVPAQWKERYFSDEAQDAPEDDEYGAVATLTAKITVSGTDDVSGKDVSAEGNADVVIGNYWDDPARLGQ